jgi:ubiquinone/menaquinone biosynthesis C-methylase UbiE
MSSTSDLPGVHLAPNIQDAPDVYELENQAADPDGKIEAAMLQIASWQDKLVLDLGAGTGYHLPHFAKNARHVIGVEPHGGSRLRMMRRIADLGLENVSVLRGSAEKTGLQDHSVAVCHARFAYFFAPNCLPGLGELQRIMEPGGTAFVIDNDLANGTFANWLSRSANWQNVNAQIVESFWAEQGFTLTRIASEWRFENRADLEAVVRNNFAPQLADAILVEHTGVRVDYHYCLYHRRY